MDKRKILILLFLSAVSSHYCPGALEAEIGEIDTGETKSRMLASSWENMRVHLDFASLNKNTKATAAQKEAIVKVMNDAKYALEHLLRVKRLTSKLKYSAATACNWSKHVEPEASKGVDADLVIVVDVWTNAPSSAVAGASACRIDGVSKRPIIGWTGFSLKHIEENKVDYAKNHFDTAIHEITHILGFSSNLYEYMDNVKVVEFTTTAGTKTETYKALHGDIMVRKAQEHFNCPDIKSIPLENSGGSGTAGSHWEHRYMMGDFMTGFVHLGTVISDITLGFLEDTTWYKPHYYTGGLFKNHKGEGCDFFKQFCKSSWKYNLTETFCKPGEKNKCDPNHHFVGKCSGNRAWGSTANEGCSAPTFFQETETYINPGDCRAVVDFNTTALKDTGVKDTYSSRSTCFEANISKANKTVKHRYARCFVPVCHKDYYTVQIENETIKCSSSKEKVQLSGYKGQIECMSYLAVCGKTSECYDTMTCIKKKSRSLYRNNEIKNNFASCSKYNASKAYDANSDFQYGKDTTGVKGGSNGRNTTEDESKYDKHCGEYEQQEKGEDEESKNSDSESNWDDFDDEKSDSKSGKGGNKPTTGNGGKGGDKPAGGDKDGESDDFGDGWTDDEKSDSKSGKGGNKPTGGSTGGSTDSEGELEGFPEIMKWAMSSEEFKKKFDCKCVAKKNRRVLFNTEELETGEESDILSLTKTQGALILLSFGLIELVLIVFYMRYRKVTQTI